MARKALSTQQVLHRAQRLLDSAIAIAPTKDGKWHLEEVTLHSEGYAEPGYTDPECGVIALGNWNRVTKYVDGKFETIDNTPARLGELFEKMGIELEWADEWVECDECSKLIRSSPNSYGWQFNGWIGECHIMCADCVLKDPEDYLNELEGDSSKAITMDLDPEKHGYTLLEDKFENGWYGGQSANPTVIAKSLEQLGIYRYLFKVDDVGQFDMQFSVYVHDSELETLDHDLWNRAKKEGPDPVNGLKRSLEQASAKMSELNGPGIKYAKCDTEKGTADVKLVSPQDFVDGKLGKE